MFKFKNKFACPLENSILIAVLVRSVYRAKNITTVSRGLNWNIFGSIKVRSSLRLFFEIRAVRIIRKSRANLPQGLLLDFSVIFMKFLNRFYQASGAKHTELFLTLAFISLYILYILYKPIKILPWSALPNFHLPRKLKILSKIEFLNIPGGAAIKTFFDPKLQLFFQSLTILIYIYLTLCFCSTDIKI